MGAYLKTLGLHAYLASTKKSDLDNDKYIEANTQALYALKHTLSKEHLSLISHCDSIFAVWNTLTSLKKQTTHILEKELIGDEYKQTCYMVQENDSLEVSSDTP